MNFGSGKCSFDHFLIKRVRWNEPMPSTLLTSSSRYDWKLLLASPTIRFAQSQFQTIPVHWSFSIASAAVILPAKSWSLWCCSSKAFHGHFHRSPCRIVPRLWACLKTFHQLSFPSSSFGGAWYSVPFFGGDSSVDGLFCRYAQSHERGILRTLVPRKAACFFILFVFLSILISSNVPIRTSTYPSVNHSIQRSFFSPTLTI